MAMKVMEFCCGCSLRTGTIIIGIFMLVSSVMITLSASGKLNSIYTRMDETAEEHKNYMQAMHGGLIVFLICLIVVGVMEAIVNALLLIGVFKEKKILVIIWLVACAVICGLGFLALVVSFFKFPNDVVYETPLLLGIGLDLYFMLVVWSFHNSPEAGYNRLHSDAVGFDTESSSIKRLSLEQPI